MSLWYIACSDTFDTSRKRVLKNQAPREPPSLCSRGRPMKTGRAEASLDVGIDPAMIALTQKQQYGGTPVGQIILRPGEDISTVAWGWLLLLGAFVFFIVSVYSLLVSEYMPETGATCGPCRWLHANAHTC